MKQYRYTLNNGFSDVILAAGYRPEGGNITFFHTSGYGFLSFPAWQIKSIVEVV